MKFEYYFNEQGQLTSKGKSSLFVVAEYDGDNFYIESAEGYVAALDIWVDVTESFKNRPTMVQAVFDQAAEDHFDAKLTEQEGSYQDEWKLFDP